MEKFNPHAKHRERMRAKIEKQGLLSLPEHEVLEALLMYAIPRKDVNPVAHSLINTFGSISKVCEADIQDLKKVNGVGDKAAIFLKSLNDFVKIYEDSKSKTFRYVLKSTQQCVKYFRSKFNIEQNEVFYVICLNKNFNVIKTHSFEGYEETSVIADTRDFITLITSKDVYYIAVFHTHPFGSVKPSKEDFIATKRILEICSAIGISLVDHIIFTETEEYSFKSNNNLIQ